MISRYRPFGYYPGVKSKSGHFNWIDSKMVDVVDGSGGGTYNLASPLYFRRGGLQTAAMDATIVTVGDSVGSGSGNPSAIVNWRTNGSTLSTSVAHTWENVATMSGSAAGIAGNPIFASSFLPSNILSTVDYTHIGLTTNLQVQFGPATNGETLWFRGTGSSALRDQTTGAWLVSAVGAAGSKYWAQLQYDSSETKWKVVAWGGSCVVTG